MCRPLIKLHPHQSMSLVPPVFCSQRSCSQVREQQLSADLLLMRYINVNAASSSILTSNDGPAGSSQVTQGPRATASAYDPLGRICTQPQHPRKIHEWPWHPTPHNLFRLFFTFDIAVLPAPALLAAGCSDFAFLSVGDEPGPDAPSFLLPSDEVPAFAPLVVSGVGVGRFAGMAWMLVMSRARSSYSA